MPGLVGASIDSMEGGRRRSGVTVKTLKRVLKKAGLKTSGKKSALTRRAKKAHLMMKGGDGDKSEEAPVTFSTDTSKPPAVPLEDAKEGGRKRRRGYPRMY